MLQHPTDSFSCFCTALLLSFFDAGVAWEIQMQAHSIELDLKNRGIPVELRRGIQLRLRIPIHGGRRTLRITLEHHGRGRLFIHGMEESEYPEGSGWDYCWIPPRLASHFPPDVVPPF